MVEVSRICYRLVGGSWRMDETYIRMKGKCKYLYRYVGESGDSADIYFRRALIHGAYVTPAARFCSLTASNHYTETTLQTGLKHCDRTEGISENKQGMGIHILTENHTS